MATNLNSIQELTALKVDWAIVARVVRMWNVPGGPRCSIPQSIELILVDDKVFMIISLVFRFLHDFSSLFMFLF